MLLAMKICGAFSFLGAGIFLFGPKKWPWWIGTGIFTLAIVAMLVCANVIHE